MLKKLIKNQIKPGKSLSTMQGQPPTQIEKWGMMRKRK